MVELPTEYKEAYDGLIRFREKIFRELVSGRVKALLDANHETLQKYGELIDRLTVVPYVFGNIRQKALALQLNSRSLGKGVIAQAKSVYVLDKAEYPIGFPPKVSARKLPQVDVFIYQPPTDVTFVEKSTEEVWASLFLLQCDHDKFLESADAENVFYDYYKLRPVGKLKVEMDLKSPVAGFENYVKVKGDTVVLVRSVTYSGDNQVKDYDVYVFIDGNLVKSDNSVDIVPFVFVITGDTAGNPEVVIVTAGKHLISSDKGVFVSWVKEGQLIGWTKTHGDYEVTVKEVLWSNISKFTIKVNDPTKGYTVPSAGEYNKKAVDITTVFAYPYSGYVVLGWDLDGVQFPASSSFTVKHYRDHVLTVIFGRGGTLTIRPIADTNVRELYSWWDAPHWDQVDDVVNDGDGSYVFVGGRNGFFKDLYEMSDINVPSSAVIESVTLYARCKTVRDYATAPIMRGRILVRIGGVIYASPYFYCDLNWTLYSWKLGNNPATGQPWTVSEINGMQVGIELEGFWDSARGQGSQGWCTQVYGDVEWHE